MAQGKDRRGMGREIAERGRVENMKHAARPNSKDRDKPQNQPPNQASTSNDPLNLRTSTSKGLKTSKPPPTYKPPPTSKPLNLHQTAKPKRQTLRDPEQRKDRDPPSTKMVRGHSTETETQIELIRTR
eukprot:sb/3475363/